MAIEPGQAVLHYRLIEKIGEGGMGVVWKAEDTRLHRRVALKFVPEEKAKDAEAVERHLREARAASALNHPHICSIYDIGEWRGRPFIVMEVLEGQALTRRIDGGAMAPREVVELALQLADALAAAHGKGIIHRDVKPANIFVLGDESGGRRAKMLDFGLAKLAMGEGADPGPDDETRTRLAQTTPGTVLGTVFYMSPEQALGKEVDRRSDIFSLGLVIYEMLTGRRAFPGSTSAEVFDGVLNRRPHPVAQLNPDVGRDLERILDKMIEKDPALRYQSAADLGADLRKLLREDSGDEGGNAPLLATSSRKRPWKSWGAVVGASILTLAVFGLWRWAARESAEGIGESQVVQPLGGSPSGAPTIAVLPFTNASGDPAQDYFSDGLTEDIISELSRYTELSVTAHGSTARYKGEALELREIGAALGVRYLLEGSVRRSGDQVRVNVELSDASDGRSLWGNRYERDLTAQDLFDLQDELTHQVVNAIAGSYGALARAELPGARRRPPASLASYDCVLRAYDYLQVHIGEKHLAARECLEDVVAADPDYADGKAWLGYLYAEEYHHRWNERPGEYVALDRALGLAQDAVQLDSASVAAHGALALTLFFRQDYERAKLETYRTIELNPNNALWLILLGTYLTQLEEFERGIAMVEKGIALNPHPPGWIRMAFFYEDYRNGRYRDALAEAVTIELPGDFREPLFVAASQGQLGLIEEAEPMVRELQARWPRSFGEMRRELVEHHAFSPALADQLLEGVEKASPGGGWPQR